MELNFRSKLSDSRSFSSNNENEEAFVYAPESCLRLLSLKGHVYGLEVSEMIDDQHADFREHRWRAEVWESRQAVLLGVGEAPRKLLAKQSAIMDMFEKLRNESPDKMLPNCRIPKGARISPLIISFLKNLCFRMNLELTDFKTTLIRIDGRDKFKTTIIVGGDVFTEISWNDRFSKYLVAMKAYNTLSEKRFELDEYYTGDSCLHKDYFKSVETEEDHVVYASRMPPNYLSDSQPPSNSDSPRKRPHLEVSTVHPLSDLLTKLRERIARRKIAGDNADFATAPPGVPQYLQLCNRNGSSSSITELKGVHNLFPSAPLAVSSGSLDSHCVEFSPDKPVNAAQENLAFTVQNTFAQQWNIRTLLPSEQLTSPNLEFMIESPEHFSEIIKDPKDWMTKREKILKSIKVLGDLVDEDDINAVESENKGELETVSLFVVGSGYGNCLQSANLACKQDVSRITRNVIRFVDKDEK